MPLSNSSPRSRPLLAVIMMALIALCCAQRASAQSPGTLSGPGFLETAAISNLFELETSKLALARTQSPQIRAFADMMVEDHTKIAARLKRAAADAKGDFTFPTALDGEHASLLEKLRAASGPAFDALYVQIQTTAHQQAVGLFGAFANDGDQTALKAFAAETLPIMQNHLAQVLKIQVKT
ncbi:DUF4142 domain-containing protein [Azorhizobium sp. AG788]|uniref:DUF4142 domain-containing protein n=1 Tax=Azorhizobium sp. AG788 TaxID=2183897 RepID=UPI003139F805